MASSNQHEFNGASPLKDIFGAEIGTEKRKFAAQWMYLNDYDDEPVIDTGSLTWYDARANHPKRTEYRLYYTSSRVSDCAEEGDELFIGLRPDDSVLLIIAEEGSTVSNQIRWLFGLADISDPSRFSVRYDLETEGDRIALASRIILEQIGISVEESDDNFLEGLIENFGSEFPTTKMFSEYARTTLPDIFPTDNPDEVLMKWVEREELLFHTFEKHLVEDRISQGFGNDVDGFFQFALSALNRRKSRAGQALENHVEHLLIPRRIEYDRSKVTENKSRPDFVFPGIQAYHDLSFESSLLTVLGVKSTCKDRWRQVLAEADRVESKHLLTFEAAISINQTSEMQHNDLQLVVPSPLHSTYTTEQQDWLMDVAGFIEMVMFRQRAISWR